jgi:cellulose synthase/poly-beta-1,6-N-acetylglucosamine synthase-like glycosyltransferase
MISSKQPLISIIIPTRGDSEYLRENIHACLHGKYKNIEIVVISDYVFTSKFVKTRIIHSGSLGPAKKRDLGARIAQGTILAFIDDDAFPSTQWLQVIVRHFRRSEIAAVGGPGMTPPHVSWQEEASGWASASPIGAWKFTYRFLPTHTQYVDDYPSMNLCVRKKDFMRVGGFDSHYYPGEDTKLCLDLTHSLGKKIMYEPMAIVYHHRRPILLPHLRQNGNFGLHRGHFARILPKTSARFIYFLPSALLFLILSNIIAIVLLNFSPFVRPYEIKLMQILAMLTIVYGGLLVINGVWIMNKAKSFLQGVLSIPIIFLTHLWYGLRFIQGFAFTKKLMQ